MEPGALIPYWHSNWIGPFVRMKARMPALATMAVVLVVWNCGRGLSAPMPCRIIGTLAGVEAEAGYHWPYVGLTWAPTHPSPLHPEGPL